MYEFVNKLRAKSSMFFFPTNTRIIKYPNASNSPLPNSLVYLLSSHCCCPSSNHMYLVNCFLLNSLLCSMVCIKVSHDSNVHGANMGPIWGRQEPGGPHVGPMNFTIWVITWIRLASTFLSCNWFVHYNDVIMGAIASQITSLTIVYSTVYSDADQRKRQSSASLAFERGIRRGPVNSPHKWPVTRNMFPFDDVIMVNT